MWLTVGWNQISFSGYNRYWYLKTPRSGAIYKEISFMAPYEKGKYEVCGFLAVNPWAKWNYNTSEYTKFETSERFTLNVR